MASTPTVIDVPKIIPNPPVDTTFRVSWKIPMKVNPKYWEAGNSSGKEHIGKLIENKSNSILHGTDFTAGGTREFIPSDNGFVQSAIHAYNHHHNLVIRPDDVWIALVIQFSRYVEGHAEEFRDKFVDFKGKKELMVLSQVVDFDDCVEKMMGKIHENIRDKSFWDWILPNFSTTAKDDYLTAGVVLMATMKSYFGFSFGFMCGIPKATLCGTVEDWEEIAKRAEKFREFNLSNWVDLLIPVLNQFVEAKKGNVSKVFWQSICNFHYPNGSAMVHLSGWIANFCVFNSEGNWQGNCIDPGNTPVGFVEVDVKLITHPDGSKVDSVLTAGHLGKWILDDKCTLQPKIGWVVSVKNDEQDVPIDFEQIEDANSARCHCFQCDGCLLPYLFYSGACDPEVVEVTDDANNAPCSYLLLLFVIWHLFCCLCCWPCLIPCYIHKYCKSCKRNCCPT